MRYFLLGLPGSGKSHWGKIWARETRNSFFDLDEVIENNEGESIKNIFKTEGEDHFRNLESFYLNKLIDNYHGLVLSTGGGTPCFNENLKLMASAGKTIFLNPPIEDIASRVWKPETNERPMFNQCKSKQEAFRVLEDLKTKRIIYYEQANIILERWDENIIKKIK
ncbi:shikimate kinase [Marivirga arenosa]|uniref:Shikimate kinase n=1 Tax=Marivirga arenosa TaxID=3059076 RepID=A0AA49GG36_9BACT|nr:shikimate kinase [Marivirga sp. BKB1-2]WKK79752.2 shikimate kinase [Marivirga sp. BKB1-2]